MQVIRKILLLLELLIGFGLLVYLWLLALTMSPILVVNLIEGNISTAPLLIAFILGGFGLWGMLLLSMKVVSPTAEIGAPVRLKFLLICGYLAIFVAIAIFGFSSSGTVLFFVLPTAVATHFIFMGRKYLRESS